MWAFRRNEEGIPKVSREKKKKLLHFFAKIFAGHFFSFFIYHGLQLHFLNENQCQCQCRIILRCALCPEYITLQNTHVFCPVQFAAAAVSCPYVDGQNHRRRRETLQGICVRDSPIKIRYTYHITYILPFLSKNSLGFVFRIPVGDSHTKVYSCCCGVVP